MDTTMTIPPPPTTASRSSNPFVRALRAPFEARTWKETIYLLLSMPIGIVTFTVIVTGVSLGFWLLITLIGIPVLFATLYVSRWMGSFERGRAALLLDTEVPRPYRADPPAGEGAWWRTPLARAKDPATWIEAVYHLLLMPIGVVTFTIVVTLWSLALGLLVAPLVSFVSPESASWFAQNVGFVVHGSRYEAVLTIGGTGYRWIIDTPWAWALLLGGGLALLFATPWIVRGLANANRAIVRGMLGRDMSARVRELTASREAAVDLANEDRRQIERDLHDGVQQRLVTLAMDLGRAKDKLDTDPEGAKELVGEAHEEAKRAITEVRDLARGIHPAVLTDRGLDAALSELVARSAIPVDVSVDVAVRPPASVEAAAYFVVSEALANIAKHARATKANITVRRVGDRLTIQVQDDGVGGADVLEGSGLAGLRDRVGALDGELHLLSPDGGPTVLMVEIPCAA
jgi:signal transduction histidine kinase